MKQDIHPEYTLATVHCACGNTFQTRSTQEDIHLDVCSVCHPYFTGKQRLMDTAGRVERFRRKWGNKGKAPAEAADAEPEAAKKDATEKEPAATAAAESAPSTAETETETES